MKPVNVETVRDRINLLETAQSEIGLLSLAAEFELACLQQLLAAKTQLAELAKQEPVGYTYNRGVNCEIVAADLNNDCPCNVDLYARPAPADDLDAKRLAFIASLADDTAPQQFDSLATNVHREIKK